MKAQTKFLITLAYWSLNALAIILTIWLPPILCNESWVSDAQSKTLWCLGVTKAILTGVLGYFIASGVLADETSQ